MNLEQVKRIRFLWWHRNRKSTMHIHTVSHDVSGVNHTISREQTPALPWKKLSYKYDVEGSVLKHRPQPFFAVQKRTTRRLSFLLARTTREEYWSFLYPKKTRTLHGSSSSGLSSLSFPPETTSYTHSPPSTLQKARGCILYITLPLLTISLRGTQDLRGWSTP